MFDSKPDKAFFDRASQFINVANEFNQNPKVKTGEVSASFMYSLTRYNAWFASTGFDNAEEMQQKKADMVAYYTEEYRKLLEGNMEDYIQNFDHYRKTQK
ncbi:DUF3144 domain-containing protein [Pseudomonadota bacterium]|uniref:DUF3144 domain-containing protein n=1 Tax=unclassified Shewanella TaxID=196818 RepID=UPI000C81D998|nr:MULTISPECIES: DUF3144 domain-containing protein [unclassified Shewanella]MDO6640193.1 DUF3144 domain-containing protein [Shewanella sp. 5_MG-2023]MDO6679327.1 DUF3144 domain-containing protein [Shewanella sp. 4_MG-2023]PMG30994.1 hypothetical protein BCU94_09880 [Shewanella sp. 10N.286.52.C2]PMI01870.1 hypothetical protein BCU55_09320 [Shewanella sp. 10N.286.48.A6]